MSKEDVQRVRGTYEAFRRGEEAAFKGAISADMTWHSSLVPLLRKRTYHGPDEVWNLLVEEIPTILEGFTVDVVDVEDLGVATLGTVRFGGTSTSTGILAEQTVFHLWRFRDGKGIEMRAFLRRADALDAAGASQ